MHTTICVTLLWLVTALPTAWADSRQSSKPPQKSLEEILANDNRSPAGQLHNGALTIVLEARTGIWCPEEKDGPELEVQALAEEGKPPQIPGPLIRVPEGTEIHATLRNNIPNATLEIHGLHARPGDPKDTIKLAPGSSREVRFRAGPPGTYFYWGSTSGTPEIRDRLSAESQLSGAFIVDPKPAELSQGSAAGKLLPDDRIFVIGVWFILDDPEAKPPRYREVLAINGRSWPHTEPLTYTVGDSARWRWINATAAVHPMHLHGFYYRVDSKGDAERDTLYADNERRLAVTEIMLPGSTMSVSWVPDRPGNWVFHCHVLPHISPERRFWRPPVREGTTSHDAAHHAREGMAGLVLGIHVLPGRKAAKLVRPDVPRRELELIALSEPGRYGKDAGLGFALQAGNKQSPAFMHIPGPPIVLTRGQPVAIRVRNRLAEPLAVHWHGIELESYFDGVPGVSGSGSHVMPPIAAGGSFVARFTPPRAGTFIYHSHIDDVRQLSSGLYGPLIVLEPGQSFDPETDRIMLLSSGGPAYDASLLLNGSAHPEPIELRAGTKYRFRFINIMAPNPPLAVSLLSGDKPVSWRAIAKDGADLPPGQATARPTQQVIGVGETYDFELQPKSSGELRLDIFRRAILATPESPAHAAPVVFRPESRIQVPVRVRDRD
jgi:FtsP/CotA-like multicopper oxidase with cupredoxin domain